MAIITSGITTLTDLNDAIISGTQPVNPTAGTLWIDSSKSPAILKIYKNGAWTTQDLDLNSLDPDMAESIKNVVATIGNMSNDNLLDFQERQQIKNDLTEILGKVILDTETVLPTVAQLEVLMKGSFYSNRRNALNAGIEAGNVLYVAVATQYQNLKTYLESLTPIKPWNVSSANKDTNITVVKDTFRDKWLQYYLATEKLSLATTEKIKEAQDDLDGKIDEVSLRDKTEILSGNPVFTDKSDDAVVHVGVDGKSVQNLNPNARNIIPTKYVDWKDGYDYDIVTGLLTPNSIRVAVPWLIEVSPNTNYYFDTGNPNVQFVIRTFDKDRNMESASWGGIGTSGARLTTGLTKYLGVALYTVVSGVSVSTEFKNGTVKPMIQLASLSDRSFEEFVPPAPSPEYPIAINSLDKSFDIVSSVGKENLVKKTGWGSHSPYNTVPIVSGNTITFTKNNTGGYSAISQPALPFGSDIVYTLSGVAKINGKPVTNTTWGTHKTASTYQGTTPLKFELDDSTGKFVITQKWTTNSAWFFHGQIFPANIGDVITIENFKIEKGTDNTPYNEHLSEISYNTQTPTLYKTNILLAEPLRSVGDVHDRVFLDTLDSLWKVERNVAEYKITGNEYWAFLGSPYNRYETGNILEPTGDLVKTTHYNSQQVNGEDSLWVSGKALRIKDDKFATVTDLTAFLKSENASGRPLTVQYQLANPIFETLSAEQQTKLNNIQSFKGSNYVYTLANVEPNLNAQFKSNMWYRMNVLGEKQVSGNRNWVTNGNLAYPLEKSLWSSYYKGTVREVVDISAEAPPFKNALHIKQTTNGVAGIIDAVIWEGAEANVLSGQNISMATWIKYQNISNESLVMQVQVTGKTSSGLFSYDYPKVFSYTGTDLTWKRQTGTVKINLPDGAVEITRVVFRLGLANAGTGEFWATGIQLETGNALGDWSINPNDTEEELNKTEARFILTEKEVGLSVKKNELINGVLVNGDGVKIDGRNVDINGLVTFGSFDTTTKNAIDSKATKTEAQGYATDAQNASKSYTDTEAGKIKTTVTAVSDIANSLKNFTDTAFSDGIIQRAEAQAISEHLNTLKKENDDLGNQYNVVYANVNLIGTPKTNLASAKTAYNTAYTNLITSINTAILGDKTTPAQKTDVDTKYTAYSTALKLLTQRLSESQTAISEKIANDLAVAKANLAETSAKAHADGKVTAEETRAINDAKAKLAEAQGYADKAVDGIEIGGTNLLPKTQSMGEAGGGGTNGGTYKGLTIIKSVKPSAGYNDTYTGKTIDVPDGLVYTISFYAKASVAVGIMNHFYSPNTTVSGLSSTGHTSTSTDGGIFVGITTEWKRYWITWKQSTTTATKTVIIGRNTSALTGTVVEIAGVKLEKGDKASDWSPAPEDIKADIESAQTDATNAKNSAGTANQLLADLSNDNILTPVEKKSVKKEWDIIVSEKSKIDVEATEFGVVTEKATYNTQYSTLNTYVTPLIANLNANSNIVATTFRTNFKNYYDARQDLLNAITSKAKTLADSATELANNASILAGTKSKTFTTTPTTPYVSGDVWKNGTAVYISTANRTSGAYVVADWVLVGDVTSANTANDVTNVGGVASGTVRDRATNGNTAYASTSLWKSTGLTTIDGGKITADSITSGAIISDVGLINKLFASTANIDTLTSKSAFITAVKAQTIDVSKITGNVSEFIKSTWSGISSAVSIDSTGITVKNSNNTINAKLKDGFIEFGDNSSTIVGGMSTAEIYDQDTYYDGVTIYTNYDKFFAINKQWTVGGSYEPVIRTAIRTKGLDIFVPTNVRGTLNMQNNQIHYVDRMYLGNTTQGLIRIASDNTNLLLANGGVRLGVGDMGSGYTTKLLVNEGFTRVYNNLEVESFSNFRNTLNMNGNQIHGVDRIYMNGTTNGLQISGSQPFLNGSTGVFLSYNGTKKLEILNTVVRLFGASLDMNSGTIINQSDRRMKKNIVNPKEDSLEAIAKWNFVDYEWIDPNKPNGVKLGLISQDTPELSVYDYESDIYSIDSSKQLMMNSHAIQQMNKKFTLEIIKLEDKIKELERNI